MSTRSRWLLGVALLVTSVGAVNVDGITRNDHSHRSIKARTDSGDVTLRAR